MMLHMAYQYKRNGASAYTMGRTFANNSALSIRHVLKKECRISSNGQKFFQ
jgi:hypothetical protein